MLAFTTWNLNYEFRKRSSIYILGIIASLYAWFKNSKSFFWDVIFYLSILGFGLFTYYQYRAHEYNLIMISWLPLLIAFMFVDRILRLVKAKKLSSKYRLLTLPIIFLGALLVINLTLGLAKLYYIENANWRAISHPGVTPISENIAFIKNHTVKAEKTVILAQNQGIYFAEAGLVSALDGPDLTQIYSSVVVAHMVNQVLTLPIKDLFIEADEHHQFPVEYKILLEKFHIQEESKAHMFYLIRNP